MNRKVQLCALFGIGGLVVVITVLRIPFILLDSVSQRTRSMVRPLPVLLLRPKSWT
jgi:hypothetical protein